MRIEREVGWKGRVTWRSGMASRFPTRRALHVSCLTHLSFIWLANLTISSPPSVPTHPPLSPHHHVSPFIIHIKYVGPPLHPTHHPTLTLLLNPTVHHHPRPHPTKQSHPGPERPSPHHSNQNIHRFSDGCGLRKKNQDILIVIFLNLRLILKLIK